MIENILVFLPIIVLIVMALLTKKMAESMIAAALLAILLKYRETFLPGIVESFYNTASSASFQFALFMLMGFGGMIKLFQESGALISFGNWAAKYASGKKKPLLLSWLISLALFVDDYLNVLTITFSMKDITDRNGIPREHLAFQANAVASCLCVLIPVSSWSSFMIGMLATQNLSFSNYVGAIPFMFYAFITVILCLLIAVGLFPKIGTLKKSYERVEAGGPPLLVEEGTTALVTIDVAENENPSSILNIIVPIAALVSGVMIFDHDLIMGIVLALFSQLLMYVLQKVMTVGQFFENFFEGAKSMCTLTIVIFFGFILNSINEELGFFNILIGGFDSSIPGWTLPVLTFLLVGFTTFATAGCLVMQLISIPLFIPVATALQFPVEPIIAAIMCGINMGYGCCFYSDSVFMTAAGTEVSNLRIIKATLPYAVVTIVLTAIAFVITGIMLT